MGRQVVNLTTSFKISSPFTNILGLFLLLEDADGTVSLNGRLYALRKINVVIVKG